MAKTKEEMKAYKAAYARKYRANKRKKLMEETGVIIPLRGRMNPVLSQEDLAEVNGFCSKAVIDEQAKLFLNNTETTAPTAPVQEEAPSPSQVAEAAKVVVDAHSMVSPSSLERVCNCPASVMMCVGLPNTESEAAAEGTVYHEIMEDLLRNPPANELEFNDRLSELNLPDDDMYENVEVGYNYISTILAKLKPTRIDIEYKLKAFYSDSDFGTLDFGCVYKDAKQRTCVMILDWKYGKGHYVEVQDNKQLISYALSYLYDLGLKDVHTVTTVVFQPRCKSRDGRIARAATYTLQSLLDTAEFIKDKVATAYAILKSNKPVDATTLCAGEHCLFCKAKCANPSINFNGCSAYYDYVNKDALVLLNDIQTDVEVKSLEDIHTNFTDINSLSNDQILKLVKFSETVLPALKSYIENCLAAVTERMQGGDKIDGLKLVYSNSRKKWIEDSTFICNTLKDVGIDAYKPPVLQLKTISAVTTELKRQNKTDLLDLLVEIPEGKARVALETDSRRVIETTMLSDL